MIRAIGSWWPSPRNTGGAGNVLSVMNRTPPPFTIGIIGAGFTGCMLAVHLLREAAGELSITLIDGGAVGRGVAFDTSNPDHLLNVRVAHMSAFADDPSHFLRWLWMQDRPEYAAIPPSGHAFVPRRVYGDYVAGVFHEICAAQPQGAITVVDTAAMQLHPGLHPAVTLADGRRLFFDCVALCTGNASSAPPSGLSDEAAASTAYVSDPWQWQQGGVEPEDDVLILGSGLTMADTVQSLLSRGHRGAIHVISRHGLLPRRHEPARTYHMPPLSGSVVCLLARVRHEIRAAVAQGYDWRHVMDALRPQIRDLWQQLTADGRASFLRHLRPYWDVHRHRLSPAVADTLDELTGQERLIVTAGRVGAIHRDGDRFSAEIAGRNGAQWRLTPRWIVNCTGPHWDAQTLGDPLLAGALARGAIRLDPLRLGLDVTAENAIVDRDGRPSQNIFAVGPPTRGRFWEVTAVPDIRGECVRVAKILCRAAGVQGPVAGAAAAAG